jgi:hypothetical protein
VIKVKESDVKKAVIQYFEGRGYFVPSVEFNIGVRPDVSAFKWANLYEIENIAVECKTTRHPRSLIQTCLTQAREYQTAFQHVYLAAPTLGDKSLQTIKSVLSLLRMGLLFVDEKLHVSVENESNTSPRLDSTEFLYRVRQRAVAILSYRDAFGVDFNLNFPDHEIVYCFFKAEPANFLLSNAYSGRDYFLGICIEQKDIVKSTLGQVKHQLLHKMLSTLPGEYSVDLEYIDTYRPREVSWSTLSKTIENISADDVKWILEYCKNADWKIRFLVMKKVWEKDELLSRDEHRKRIEAVKSELLPIRRTLTKTTE